MGESNIAFILHATQNCGDHAMEYDETVMFAADATVQELLDFIKVCPGTLKLTAQVDGKAVIHARKNDQDIPF